MSKNRLKRKQDKQKKHHKADRAKLLKKRKALIKKKKEEKETSKLQRDIQRLQNRVGGSTIRSKKSEVEKTLEKTLEDSP